MPIDPLLVRTPGGSTEPVKVSQPFETERSESQLFISNDDIVGEPDGVDMIFDEVDQVEDVVVREDVESAYRRLYPQLVRLALLLVDTCEHAEEAVQDAFAKAYPKWGRIENPDAYMRMAVVHTCRSVQRRRGLMRRTPAHRVDDAALGADHVADVVRRLPLKLRQVVVLRYYLQLSDPEIAHTLGMALGTVKSTLHRARAQMREELS